MRRCIISPYLPNDQEIQRRGGEVREISFQSSHAVYATKTREIVDLVQDIATLEERAA